MAHAEDLEDEVSPSRVEARRARPSVRQLRDALTVGLGGAIALSVIAYFINPAAGTAVLLLMSAIVVASITMEWWLRQ